MRSADGLIVFSGGGKLLGLRRAPVIHADGIDRLATFCFRKGFRAMAVAPADMDIGRGQFPVAQPAPDRNVGHAVALAETGGPYDVSAANRRRSQAAVSGFSLFYRGHVWDTSLAQSALTLHHMNLDSTEPVQREFSCLY
jgi:hypothetical protein